VAVARKLGIRLWIMLRDQIEYNEFCRRGQKQQKSSDAKRCLVGNTELMNANGLGKLGSQR
jgi:hypothetical protein